MPRRILLVTLAWAVSLSAQLQPRSDEEKATLPSDSTVTEGMVDEDEDVLPQTEYVFNPIQAKKDLKVGKFYEKKGNHRAAAARYLEATRWDPGMAEAYWRLGEARDELGQHAQALDAYRDYLAAEPEGKQAGDAKQRIAALEKKIEQLPLAATEAEGAQP